MSIATVIVSVALAALLAFSGAGRLRRDPGQMQTAVGAVQALTAMLRVGNYDALDGTDTVTVVTGHATFLDAHTVGVGDGTDRRPISAETILVNTGSEPAVPDIPGLRGSKHVLTSSELMETADLPRRLAVVGGGYLGVEFASTCAPASHTSTRSATSTAGRSSPTSPSTPPASCSTSSSAPAGVPRPTGSRSRAPCS